ncbi:MAG: TonB-dependent receptor [Chitinophagaceae bacterium]
MKTLITLIISIISFSAFSQTTIKGKVIDAVSRQALENASIQEDNNPTVNTITDAYGNFSLKLSKADAAIIVSYIGYEKITLAADANAISKIELQPAGVDLKDVVVLQGNSSTRFSTLTKVELELKPVRNTQELLRLVPGLFIAQHAGGGKAEQIFLRGFDCDHGTDVQVSVDGMPVNMVSHAHGQGYADSHFLIPETINNVDFGAGPYYTQHGNLNTAGYVAFSTYNNIPASRIQVEAGRYNTYRTLAMIDLLKKNKDKQSAFIASEFYCTNGPTINKQNFNRFNIFGKYNLAISDHTQLTASASGFKSKWDASGQVPTRAVESGLIDRFGSIDPSEGGHTERYNANLVLSHSFKNGATWENQAFYSRYIFSLYSDFTFFLDDPINGDEINQAEKRNIFGYASKLSRKKYYDGLTLTSTYGVGMRYDATENSQLAHVVKRRFLGNVKLGNIKEANAYGYIQEQISTGKWLFDAGLRFDYFHFDYIDKLMATQSPTQTKTILSPKFNLQYTINGNVQLFVKAGKGFHSNDTRVVIANDGKEILPAAYGGDIGVILKPTNSLLINIAAWYLQLNQEFVYVGDAGVVEPSGKTRREGIDLIARYQLNKNLFANINLNFTKPRAIGEAKGRDYIPLAPTATSTGGLFYKAQQGFNGSLTYRFIKNRPANEDNSVVAKGYFVVDAALNYTRKKYEIGLAIENLTNTEWNEAQFDTESQLRGEASPVSELHYTPGIPFFGRVKLAFFF